MTKKNIYILRETTHLKDFSDFELIEIHDPRYKEFLTIEETITKQIERSHEKICRAIPYNIYMSFDKNALIDKYNEILDNDLIWYNNIIRQIKDRKKLINSERI